MHIIEPVEYNLITFKDNKTRVSYTDCFEVSLLRFLHFVFNNDYKMDIVKMKSFMFNTKYCKQLVKFFENNNDIHHDAEYYDTDEGIKIRTKWCIFLNKRFFFQYKLEGKYEVCASNGNLIMFFKMFTPKIIFDVDIDNINKIFKSVDPKLSVIVKVNEEEHYDRIYYQTNTNILLDGKKIYNWMIYQYFENDNGTMGRRITGHSSLQLL